MRAYCPATWVIAGLLANSAAQAQITTQVTLNFSGTANEAIGGEYAELTGVGNITPFGPATFAGTTGNAATYRFTFYLASGGSLQIGAENGAGAFGSGELLRLFPNLNDVLGGTGPFPK
jgi:hypothetical protein